MTLPLDLGAMGLDERVKFAMENAMLLAEDRRILSTYLGPYWVSTVWMPPDLQGHPLRGAIYFETMVFGADQEEGRRPFTDRIWRTAERAHAVTGHRDVCQVIALNLLEHATPGRTRHGMVRHVRSVRRELAAQGLTIELRRS